VNGRIKEVYSEVVLPINKMVKDEINFLSFKDFSVENNIFKILKHNSKEELVELNEEIENIKKWQAEIDLAGKDERLTFFGAEFVKSDSKNAD